MRFVHKTKDDFVLGSIFFSQLTPNIGKVSIAGTTLPNNASVPSSKIVIVYKAVAPSGQASLNQLIIVTKVFGIQGSPQFVVDEKLPSKRQTVHIHAVLAGEVDHLARAIRIVSVSQLFVGAIDPIHGTGSLFIQLACAERWSSMEHHHTSVLTPNSKLGDGQFCRMSRGVKMTNPAMFTPLNDRAARALPKLSAKIVPANKAESMTANECVVKTKYRTEKNGLDL